MSRPFKNGKGSRKTEAERKETHTARFGKKAKLPSRKFKNRRK